MGFGRQEAKAGWPSYVVEVTMDLFDGEEGERRKAEGMERAKSNRLSELEIARLYAVEIARRRGDITADDVGRAIKLYEGIDTLGPAAGSLFKGDRWEWTGRFKKSVRVKNHARLLRVWRLKQC